MPSSGRCITHDLWEGLSHQIQLYLSSVSLGDVVDGRIAERQAAGVDTRRKPVGIANAAD